MLPIYTFYQQEHNTQSLIRFQVLAFPCCDKAVANIHRTKAKMIVKNGEGARNCGDSVEICGFEFKSENHCTQLMRDIMPDSLWDFCWSGKHLI